MASYKYAFIFGCVLTGLMCLYPPYKCTGVSADGIFPLKEGYGPVFAPNQDQHYNTGRSRYSVTYTTNFDRLYGQIIFAGIIWGGMTTVLFTMHVAKRDKSESDQETETETEQEESSREPEKT